jgi:hypothetical protein
MFFQNENFFLIHPVFFNLGYLGDSCVKAEQCIGRGRTSSITSSGVDLADMECVKGKEMFKTHL